MWKMYYFKLMIISKKEKAGPLRGLLTLLAKRKGTFLLAMLSLGMQVTANTFAFLLIRYLFDKVLKPENTSLALYPFAFGFIILAAIRGLFAFFAGRLNGHLAEDITRNIRNSFYDHIQRLSFTFHDKNQTGELVQRATSDVDAVRRFFAEQVPGIMRIIFLFAINYGMIIYLDFKLGLQSRGPGTRITS